jgi:hypothetical protein
MPAQLVDDSELRLSESSRTTPSPAPLTLLKQELNRKFALAFAFADK